MIDELTLAAALRTKAKELERIYGIYTAPDHIRARIDALRDVAAAVSDSTRTGPGVRF